MDISVTIIVKASNQQFDDQTIKCELNWTIRKVKEYLAEVYPCKPTPEEQKLIYSGQLLNDKAVLKDTLRQYDDQVENNQTHIMHLVCVTKFLPKPKENLTSKVGELRRRNVTTNSNPTTQTNNLQNNSQSNMFCRSNNNNNNNNDNNNSNLNNNTGAVNQNPNEINSQGNNSIEQQLAMQNWLQNVYMQYFNQYMNFLQLGIPPERMYTNPGNITMQSVASLYSMNPTVIPTLPSQTTQVITPLTPSSTSQSIPVSQVNTPSGGVGVNESTRAQFPEAQNPEQNLENPPQPRFPNIVVEEIPENRDWLDMFYTMSRLMIFLTLIYFYSSPIRCLIVLFIGIALYLYHIGIFRSNLPDVNQIRRLNEMIMNNNNNNNNNNEENINNNNNNNEQLEQQNQENINGLPENSGDQVNNENPSSDVDNTETRSILSFIRSFVVSFIISLVPETPAL